jgi:cysteine desulfurase
VRAYLDANATTPLDPRVREAMLPYLSDEFGNASSVHRWGQRARAAVDEARERVARALGCEPAEIVFTSGGTEADNLAVKGAFLALRERGGGIVVSAVEHPAVLEAAGALRPLGARITVTPVRGDGTLDLEALARACAEPGTVLVSAMWANNETGVLFPVDEVARIAHANGALYHCDAVQAAGKVALDVRACGADLVSVSAHKIHGPKGAGALYVRRGVKLSPLFSGGHQERGRRGGTENVAALVGFAAALDLAVLEERVRAMRDRLERALVELVPGARVNGAGAPRAGNTLNLCFEGVEGEALLAALDLEGIAASSGSACSSGSLEPSPVLLAMGVPREIARGALRLSLSRMTTDAEVDYAVATIPRVLERLRGRRA